MNKKINEIFCLVVLVTLLLTACTQTAPEAESIEEITVEEVEVTETPTATDIPPTQTPTSILVPPSPTPLTPDFYGDTGFPIGKFTSESDDRILSFRADGSCRLERALYMECYYGVNGNLYADMWFTCPFAEAGLRVPATYYWEFDGSHLTFTLYGEELNDLRGTFYTKTYTYTGPVFLGTEVKEDNFPRGRFVSASGTRAFEFDEGGTWRFYDGDLENPVRSGKYITNGELYTEMTHDDPDEQQVPVTYTWTFDGQNLSFELLWGEDLIPYREGTYNHQTYIWVED